MNKELEQRINEIEEMIDESEYCGTIGRTIFNGHKMDIYRINDEKFLIVYEVQDSVGFTIDINAIEISVGENIYGVEIEDKFWYGTDYSTLEKLSSLFGYEYLL